MCSCVLQIRIRKNEVIVLLFIVKKSLTTETLIMISVVAIQEKYTPLNKNEGKFSLFGNIQVVSHEG